MMFPNLYCYPWLSSRAVRERSAILVQMLNARNLFAKLHTHRLHCFFNPQILPGLNSVGAVGDQGS
jgi:hypothetical protein